MACEKIWFWKDVVFNDVNDVNDVNEWASMVVYIADLKSGIGPSTSYLMIV